MKYQEFISKYAAHPSYFAPRGTELNAKSWQTEAPLRMLLNNLDAEVAENPDELVVYGGIGQAARNREALENIIKILLDLDENHSLLVQSGKPVGVVRTHPQAPRVLIANSNLVPKWATWEHFYELREKGLMMYGQMTAGSWIYIGSQGIVQGTYETFVECGRQHFHNNLKGKLLVTAGLGGMGGAQPLAATMAGAVCLAADINPASIQKRVDTKYLDIWAKTYEEGRDLALKFQKEGIGKSIGIEMDAGDFLQRLIDDGITPDILTDQTSAHDPINGYVPHGISFKEAIALRKSNPEKYQKMAIESMARHVRLMLEMQQNGAVTFDYGNNIRAFAEQGGIKNAFDFPGFTPAYIRPLFCEGKGPFRWVALSGNPEDIYKTDQVLLELFPENQALKTWINQAQEKIAFQGLPARICWLGLGEREKAGLKFNDMVRKGDLSAPIVIGRDHLDCGSVASPNRETEAMKDGSDAVSDWALLNLLGNASGGATWVSFHHGGGVGMGYSQHAGMVVLADGTDRAEECLKRVLFNDPAMGIYRHADAGYEKALEVKGKFGI